MTTTRTGRSSYTARTAVPTTPVVATAEPKAAEPKMIPTETCGGCVYWNVVEKTNGECRRYPPILVSIISLSPGRLSPASWAFPQIDADDWCGDYKIRPVTP